MELNGILKITERIANGRSDYRLVNSYNPTKRGKLPKTLDNHFW